MDIPHLYYDEDTERLWMAWGGRRIYMCELDPATARLINDPRDKEFRSHPPGTHTLVVLWKGDEWTDGNEWVEGATLYKHNGYWYLFASYGSLMNNYTIRMGRGKQPTGPFYDRDGVALTQFDEAEDEYGNSFFLGDDGDQLIPGHAHIWKENGQFFVGYDYRTEKALEGEREPRDIFGIRELHWVNDWPTIWTPIKVTFRADDHPEAIGKKPVISFRNVGDQESVMAVDFVTLRVSSISGKRKSNSKSNFEDWKNAGRWLFYNNSTSTMLLHPEALLTAWLQTYL